jgi:hypothetical protein
MKRFQSLLTKHQHRKGLREAGVVTLTEAMVAAVATSLVIGASALGLRATETLIGQSSNKATLRQNTTNGMRLMRSEVERSIHLVVNNSGGFPEGQDHLDLSNGRYSDTLATCSNLAGGAGFQPIFGAKMIELTEPVIYGVSTNPNGLGYTLKRCGAPLKLDGNYNDETEDIFISTILDDIGRIPCLSNECSTEQPLASTLSSINFTFSEGFTPYRQPYEPAIRVETDSNFKLVKFVDPTEASPESDNIKASFLEKRTNTKTITKRDLHFAAFARADKRVNDLDDDGNGGILSGAFFQNITSDRVRFVVDGSGSMSACVLWGDGYSQWRKFYRPGQGYFQTNRRCALTRMESLQRELAVILDKLPNDTRIGLRSFSSSGYQNHKVWNTYGTNLKRLGDEGVRDSAIAFVYSLDDKTPSSWGGTDPWDAIQAAFDDSETDALYFLSDGKPNRDPFGGYWGSSDEDSTANHYAGLNTGRSINLKVHTTALGLESSWMEKLAQLTGGGYNEIDRDSIGNASSL